MAYAHHQDDDPPAVGMSFVQYQLGRQNYGARRLCSYVALLVRECGFPPPLPSLAQSRRDKGAAATHAATPAIADALDHGVTMDSRWRRDAVECWLQDFTPPTAAAAIEARDRRTAAVEMDSAASALRLVRGGRA